jgi:lipopolysaccharide biosynthesis glycosyltransferase
MILATSSLNPRIRSEDRFRKDPSIKEVVVVCACDNNYAMPLAVMLHSAATTLRPGSRLSVYFIDGGVSEEGWIALQETLHGLPIDVVSIQPDYSLVEHLHTSHHVTPSAYLRLLAAELLPAGVTRALYLDSDLVIREDLVKLWDQGLGDHQLLAVPDIACPFIDARLGCANWRRAIPWLASLRPIANYRELKLDPSAEYFNSGVMLINVEAWRQDQVAARMLDCLEQNRDHVWCWDQYALNVIFHGKWGRLPMRWNRGMHVFDFPSPQQSPVDPDEFREMLEHPAIVHYTTEFKPWHYRWKDRHSEEFYRALDQTSYAGWRPVKPDFSWRALSDAVGLEIVRAVVPRWRRLMTLFPEKSQ